MIAVLIIGANVFMAFLAVSKVPFFLSTYIGGLSINRYTIFAIIVVFYVLSGMFLDIMGAIFLTLPIIYPIIKTLGFDPIWFGVIVVILMEMGLITPPVGLNVFALAGVIDVPMQTIFRGIWPFVLAMVVCIITLTIFPQIATFLPMGMRG
jgi:TRAP-type C4-dicarboxylate transport system permease large subunit